MCPLTAKDTDIKGCIRLLHGAVELRGLLVAMPNVREEFDIDPPYLEARIILKVTPENRAPSSEHAS